MPEQIAFFIRGKPQDADAFPIFERAKRVFIGYPMVKRNHSYDPRNLRKCLVHYGCPDEEWAWEIQAIARTNIYSQNRNFVRAITPNSIVIVPRPHRGLVYAGYVTGDFDVVDDPPWADEYLSLRKAAKLNVNDAERQHVADVALGWPIDEFRPIEISRLPAWMRYHMFGRSTYGRFGHHPLDHSITSYSVLDRLIRGEKFPPIEWTLDHEQAAQRLVETLSPSAFEHLAVSLLQLEFPSEIWTQTGGSGDDGIDGLGSTPDGSCAGLLQCKWYAETAPSLGGLGPSANIRRYAAVLLPRTPEAPEDGTTLLDLRWVTDHVVKHRHRLPQALSMRIGEP
jgi:hypothetical protein